MMRNYMHFGYSIEVPRWIGYDLLSEDLYLGVSVEREDAAFIYRLVEWRQPPVWGNSALRERERESR